ncbi:MAG: ornithine--oxo-acid transaminase [Betaproteobacteria bacterium]|nr:ornithine--oxo-acid transaminase [Betaproteobacteria bacterium]
MVLPTFHTSSPRTARVIGVASGLGARDQRCEDGPDALEGGGFISHLQSRGVDISWKQTLRPGRAGGWSATEKLAALFDHLARETRNVVLAGERPVVLGGDHSCAVGTWKGVNLALGGRNPLGLIWIDAHLDAHTPRTSPSGAVHGMPLALLLGYGDPLLTPKEGTLRPEQVCVIGARDFEPEEASLLLWLGVRVFPMEEVRHRGLAAVMAEALDRAGRGSAGFGLTIDLDGLDPRDAPAVGTPVPDGISGRELTAALRGLGSHPAFVALEIAEFNPHLDREGVTARLVEDLTASALHVPALSMPAIAAEQAYGAHNYEPLPVVLCRGDGVWLWDQDGKRYLDMMSAYSAVGFGHAHPRLVRTLSEQARTLAMVSRAFYNDRLPYFLKRLCELTGQDRALPANTGLEAVEAGLKAARKWAYKVKGVAPDRAEIIACEGNFHGRSIAIVGMSSEPQYRDGFGPFPPGFRLVPYGDAQALERAITPDTAAFLVEAVQCESGIRVPPRGYLTACADICRQHNVLLLCDEVQTGLGRTGKFLACEHEGVKPDGLMLGKALGGGLVPVSAFLAREDVLGVFRPGDHGSTFGGNPLAAAVALDALALLLEERLIERSAELGARFLALLHAIESPLIREVRGLGLLAGIEVDTRKTSARRVCERLMDHGILTKDTHESVVRLAPPLIITLEQIEWAAGQIRSVFEELNDELRRAA